MENLIIESTLASPGITFISDGHFTIEGRSLPDNAIKAFELVFKWLENFHSEKVDLNIKLEYLNTSASMQLFNILKCLDEKPEIKEIAVIWHYEEDDEDHLETGLIFADQLNRVAFTYCKDSAIAA